MISPDGDGVADVLAISYSLGARAAVTATVKDVSGTVVASIFTGQVQGARRQSFPYAADGLADGTYTLTISAVTDDGRSAHLEAPFCDRPHPLGAGADDGSADAERRRRDDTIGIGVHARGSRRT